MEIKARKPLRKKEYDYSSNGLYFVTICVKNREKILCKIVGGGVPYKFCVIKNNIGI